MEVTKVSKEALEKALQTLNLVKIEPAVDAAKIEELKKAEEAKALLETEYKATIQKAEELKAKMEGKTVTEKPKEIVKAEIITPLNTEFEKATKEQIGALGTLVQSKNEEIDELKKGMSDVMAELKKATEFNQLLGKKIGIIEKQPLDRKSVTTTTFIEKGGDGKPSEGGLIKKSMSNKSDKKEIADILFEKATEDGKKLNEEFAKAVEYVELGKFPTQESARKVQNFLAKEHKIELVN